MKIIVSLFGEPKEKTVLSLIEEYAKRTRRYQSIEFKYVRKYEGLEIFLNDLFDGDRKFSSAVGRTIVLLTEKGNELDTHKFSKFYEKKLGSGVKELWFCIGPAEGWGDAVGSSRQVSGEGFLHKDVELLSLSKMTMQHDIAFLVLVEQVYRVVSIKNNLPYHK
jgi:23S rRNA (pseudouridine1915-N3)-methyltransferase